MIKQSRHYCPTCQQKTLHQTEKYGLIAFIFTFGLSAIANMLKGTGLPRCQVCGTRRSMIPFRGMFAR